MGCVMASVMLVSTVYLIARVQCPPFLQYYHPLVARPQLYPRLETVLGSIGA